ncbi:MAG: S8 family serine peptidase [Vicinamibacteraceae bacterium]
MPLPLARGAVFGLDQLGAAVGLLPGNPLLETVRGLLPTFVVRRAFADLTDAEMDALVGRAQEQDPAYLPPVWANFLYIEDPPALVVDGLVAALGLWVGIVEFAYRTATPSDPGVIATANPLFAGQGYLSAAPTGIGVQTAWAAGADGSDTRYVDLEQGWLLTHEDLPPGIPLLAGANRPESFAHGCAVLGIVSGLDNTRGVVGIAPASLPRVVSHFDTNDDLTAKRARIASRIVFAANSLRFGDVLQLEVQLDVVVDGKSGHAPVEIDPLVFEAIRLVVKVGVIVVEAAGNDGADLDRFTFKGKFVLKRGGPDFKDSGAIVVGGCSAAVPHQRFDHLLPDGTRESSSFGSRVDCCAWGERVTACGSKTVPTVIDAYRAGPAYEQFFRGTSASTPIITGTCLLIQHLQAILPPRPGQLGKLGPATMRRILSSPGNGTPVTGNVGPMPDFVKILAAEFSTTTVPIHVKVLDVPAIDIDQMIANANTVFGPLGIHLVEASRETIDVEDGDLTRFVTLVVGSGDDGPTADQLDLFNLRAGAGPRDIVVYFVRTLLPAAGGSAIHPPDRPGVVVSTAMASEWTLAHQLGHVLGLGHVDDATALMTRHSTSALVDLPPDVSDGEAAAIFARLLA